MAPEKQFSSSIILTMDIIISVMCSLLAILIVRWLSEPVFQFQKYVLIWLSLAITGSVIGFLFTKSHKVVVRHSSFRNISKLATAVVIKEALLLICMLVNLFSIKNVNGNILIIVLDALMSLCALVLVRVFIIMILDYRMESVDRNIERMSVMVFGTTNKSVSLLPRFEFSPNYNVVGFITDDDGSNGKIIQDKKIYSCASEDELREICAKLGGIDCIIFAQQKDSEAQEGRLVRWCINLGIHVLLAPKVEEVNYEGISRELVNKVSRNVDYIPDGMSSFERNAKRAFDCALSAILIVVFSPLMLICYLAIKFSDGGPAIYRQERIGRFGRPFDIYKFRSMRIDAESAGPAIYSGDEDPRLTKVGKFLRQHHLDELPQLFNVFKGDMAFIGYRPERKYYIDQIMKVDPRYYYLYQIRPGVTSYATLHNGYTDTLDKMVRRLHYDLYYLKNRSWWFDAKVLWETFASIVFGKKF